jgi:hypothetical protein
MLGPPPTPGAHAHAVEGGAGRAVKGAEATVHAQTSAFGHAVHYASRHTGVPAVVVASIALVAGYRLLRRTVRFAVQLTIAMTIVLVAVYFGWLTF